MGHPWFLPWGLTTQEGPRPWPRAPLSAGLHASGPLCSWGLLWSGLIPFCPRVITYQSQTVTLPRSRNGMERPSRAWMSHQLASSSGPYLSRWRSWASMPHLHWSRGGGASVSGYRPNRRWAGFGCFGIALHPLPPEFGRVQDGGDGRVPRSGRGQSQQSCGCSCVCPNFPGALLSGKFIMPGKPLFTKGVPVSHLAIPSATLRLSQDDMLLIPERSCLSKLPHLTSIPERYLVDSEELARRGLEITSVMDSFLGGLVGRNRAVQDSKG